MEPMLVTSVVKDTTNAPVLIIDHNGTIGEAIYEWIKNELTTAFVSSKKPTSRDNIIYIPYKHHFPQIPNEVYSSIVFVGNNEKDLSHLVKKCCAKAKQDKVPFIFICDYRTVNETLVTKMVEYYSESYVAIVGELFGHGETLLDQYILQAGTTRSISLPHMGLRKTHPVLFTDTIQAILQTVFGIQKQHKITYFFQETFYTDLSIAHILQKADPLIHIDFLKQNKKKETEEKNLRLYGRYYFDQTYSVSEKIIEAYKTASTLRKEHVDEYIHKEEFHPLIDLEEGSGFSVIPEGTPFWIRRVLLYLVLVITIPLICLTISILIGIFSLLSLQKTFQSGQLEQASIEASIGYGSFVFDNLITMPIGFELQTVGLGNIASELRTKITIGQNITGSVRTILHSLDESRNIIIGKSINPQKDSAAIVSTTRAALICLENLIVDNPSEKQLTSGIEKYQEAIKLGAGIVGLLPDMLAVTSKHTYLILLEDNTQLRPGGGFISSYALVTFDHGKLTQIQSYPVDDADKLLHQHVDPPFAIRRFMQTIHLYLRDSNFDVDFVANAKKASELFHIETGQTIDGVIGLDMTFFKDVLGVIGSVRLDTEQVSVSKDNVLQEIIDHTKNQTGQIAQENPFIPDIFTAIQKSLFAKQLPLNTIVTTFLSEVSQKHLLFAMANLTDQNTLTVNHVSGSLWDPRTESSGVINDYMGISEANIGQNSANYFISRSIKQAVAIDGEGNLTGRVDLMYTNKSTASQIIGGDYKNYLRIILPDQTTLTSIAFDGQTQATQSAITDPEIYEAKGFRSPQTLEIEQIKEENKTIFGFLVTIPATTTKTVTISYTHNQKINLANPLLHYRLTIFKQPGTMNDAFSYDFNFPLDYTILSATPQSQNGTSDYSVTTQLSTDQTIMVDLTKK